MKFTRKQITKTVTAESGIDTRTARDLTDLVFNAIRQALEDGHTVEIRGFGSFEVKGRKARTARNPKTGETITAPAWRGVVFRPGQELKAALLAHNGEPEGGA
jgi:nucleoid DNA-binding protein